MIVTLTDADVKSIVEFYAEEGVPLAPALVERMSAEQRKTTAKMMRVVGERHLAHAEELQRLRQMQRIADARR